MDELKTYYAVRDVQSGMYLRNSFLAKDGDAQLYRNPGPAKAVITKARRTNYFLQGNGGYSPENLEVVEIKLMPGRSIYH